MKKDSKDMYSANNPDNSSQGYCQTILLEERPINWPIFVLVCFGIFLCTTIVISFVTTIGGTIVFGREALSGPVLSDITNLSSLAADLIVAAILIQKLKKAKIWHLSLSGKCTKTFENLFWIILIFLAFFYGEICAAEVLDDVLDTKASSAEQQLLLTQGNRILMLINVALVVPITEEIVFRGAIYGGLRQVTGVFPAALVSGVVFGIAHLNGWISVVTLVMGILLCLVYEKTGSIAFPILIHGANNYISVTLNEIYLPDGESKIIGAMVASIACLVVFVYVFLLRNKDAAGLKAGRKPET